VTRDQDIEVVSNGTVLELRNISEHFIKLSKMVADGEAMSGFRPLIEPGTSQRMDLQKPTKKIRLEYEEAFPADAVLPRKLALVVGRAEPRMRAARSLRKLASKAKKVPASNVREFQDKFFHVTRLSQFKSHKDIVSLKRESRSPKGRK
jgi:hypothetical protein